MLLNISQTSQKKNLYQSLFLINKKTLLKRDSYTAVSLRNLQKKFKSILFCRAPTVATSEAKHIHASAVNLLHIRTGNLNCCEAREIDFLCCREKNAMLIASAKVLESEGSISLCSFYGQLPDYQSRELPSYTLQMSFSFFPSNTLCEWCGN